MKQPALLAAALATLVALVSAATTAEAATIHTATVARVGAGAARLTVFTNGAGTLYVNLKGLAPGRWNEHLWSGTCDRLGTCVAVLPGLIVPAGGAVARTNTLTAGQATGRTLRLVSGSRVLCTTFHPDAAPLAPSGPTEAAHVVRLVDGDTIIVDRGHGNERVRYLGMDTPETVDPRQPVEWMGPEASAANRALVDGRQVVLERDVRDVDQYGRLLRYIWLRDGPGWRLVNLLLVERGFAQVDTVPPDVKYADLLLAAQRDAREHERGLWAPR